MYGCPYTYVCMYVWSAKKKPKEQQPERKKKRIQM